MEGKVAVLGSSDFVMPFSALGFDTYIAEDGAESVVSAAKEILKGKYSLIVVAETVAVDAEEVFSAVEKQATPAVVVVPFTTESTGYSTAALGKVLKMATGIDIVQDG